MHNFELSINEEINLYINYNITPNELFILRLLFLAIDGNQKFLINYLSNINNGKKIFRDILLSLQEKKVINSTFKIPNEGESLNFKNIPFNKNFIKGYIRESNEIGKELFDSYPPFITINGRMFSIKNFTKAGLFSLEDFCLFYAKAIKNSNITHEKVMDTLQFGKENNLINYSINKIVAYYSNIIWRNSFNCWKIFFIPFTFFVKIIL